MARIEECILYRNFDNGEVLDIMTSLMNSYEAGEEGFENRKEEFFHMAGSLVEMAGMYGFYCKMSRRRNPSLRYCRGANV